MESVSTDTLPLVESLNGLLQGGKRLRAAFAYWGYRATGRIDSDAIVRAASSLEFLQACALIHDDVMDNSDTRRGKPASHKQFESLHKNSSWHADSAKFGEGAAILIGDLALSWADELLFVSGLEPDELHRAKTVYDIMRTELMAGQYLDLLEQARRNTTEPRALTVIRYKSAKYTIERPLHMGAAIANAAPALMDALSAYGLALGEAFQLRDDVLGVFGDAAVTGKPAGDDLRERKQTVLVARTIAALDSADRERFNQLFAADSNTNEEISELQALIGNSGALSSVEATIEEQTDAALNAIQLDECDAQAREALTQLAILATQRTF
jgi:geranylgeranyl diphosphate synthase type I